VGGGGGTDEEKKMEFFIKTVFLQKDIYIRTVLRGAPSKVFFST
jgi:hypothetical protein